MSIQVGDRLPESQFRVMTVDGPQVRTTADVFAGRTMILFAVPGAFTPTCHRNHLPGYVAHLDDFKAKGIDGIAVTGVNDQFVMKAWADATGAGDKLTFLADGNGDFAKAVGLFMDGSGFGLGLRSQRYAMLVRDGVVEKLLLEDTPSKAEISGADAMMKALAEV